MRQKSIRAERAVNLIWGTAFHIFLLTMILIMGGAALILLGLQLFLITQMYKRVPEGRGLLLVRAFGGYSRIWLPPGWNFTWYPILIARRKNIFSTQKREIRRQLIVTSQNGYKVYSQKEMLIVVSTFDPYVQIAENEGGQSQADDLIFRAIEKLAKDIASENTGDTIVKDFPDDNSYFEDQIAKRLKDQVISVHGRGVIRTHGHIIEGTGNVVHQIDVPDMDYAPDLRKEIDVNLARKKTAETQADINEITRNSMRDTLKDYRDMGLDVSDERLLQTAEINNDLYKEGEFKRNVHDIHLSKEASEASGDVKGVVENLAEIAKYLRGQK